MPKPEDFEEFLQHALRWTHRIPRENVLMPNGEDPDRNAESQEEYFGWAPSDELVNRLPHFEPRDMRTCPLCHGYGYIGKDSL
jgi:hypothetical protein